MEESQTTDTPAHDLTRHFVTLLRDHVIAGRRSDGAIWHKAIAVRVIVLTLLLDPPQASWSLNTVARQLKCSRAWLSRIGLKFADNQGLRAHWQRLEARDTYASAAERGHRTRKINKRGGVRQALVTS